MKISQPNVGYVDPQRVRQDLLQLSAQPAAAEVPPCPGCKQHIPASCSSRCTEAPKSLSIDPVNYPIELKILPLVFELAATRVMQPCWSCEGHLDPDGKLWKIPQVSFYSASPVYLQLLLKHIQALGFHKKLAFPWHVVLSDYGQSWETTYTLEPNLVREHTVHLGNLQYDINTLADNLCNKLKALAQVALNEMKSGTQQQ